MVSSIENVRWAKARVGSVVLWKTQIEFRVTLRARLQLLLHNVCLFNVNPFSRGRAFLVQIFLRKDGIESET